MMLLTTFAILAFAYSLVSQWLDTTVITGPIFFTVAGIVLAAIAPVELNARDNGKIFLHLAEVGLVLLLFSDAAHTNLSVLWNIRELPARLLALAGRLPWRQERSRRG